MKNIYTFWKIIGGIALTLLMLFSFIFWQGRYDISKYLIIKNPRIKLSPVVGNFITLTEFEDFEHWKVGKKYEDYISLNYAREPKKGVITYISEVSQNRFVVESEVLINSHKESHAIITYLDKTTSTLYAKYCNNLQGTYIMKLVISDIYPQYKCVHCNNNNLSEFIPTYDTRIHTLPYVLLSSNFGYYLGKDLDVLPNPNVYRFPHFYTPNSGLTRVHPMYNGIYDGLYYSSIPYPSVIKIKELSLGGKYIYKDDKMDKFNDAHFHYLTNVKLSDKFENPYQDLYKGDNGEIFADNSRSLVPYWILFGFNGIAIVAYIIFLLRKETYINQQSQFEPKSIIGKPKANDIRMPLNDIKEVNKGFFEGRKKEDEF